jgi:hypothetical protein
MAVVMMMMIIIMVIIIIMDPIGWRKLHSEELHNLYSSSNIIRVDQIKEDEMDGTCSTHERNE